MAIGKVNKFIFLNSILILSNKRVRTVVIIYSHCFCTVITSELCQTSLNETKEVEKKEEIAEV